MCRGNHWWTGDLHHISHGVCQDTATAGPEDWGGQEVQGPHRLCQGDGEGTWRARSVPRSQCAVVWIYTQVCRQVSGGGKTYILEGGQGRDVRFGQIGTKWDNSGTS